MPCNNKYRIKNNMKKMTEQKFTEIVENQGWPVEGIVISNDVDKQPTSKTNDMNESNNKSEENRDHLYAVKADDEFPCTHSALEFHAAYLTNRMRFYLECAEQGRTDLAKIIKEDLEMEDINARFYFRHANEEYLDKKKEVDAEILSRIDYFVEEVLKRMKEDYPSMCREDKPEMSSNENTNLSVGEKHRHYNGNVYEIIGIANDPPTEKYPLTVVYKGKNGKLWARPLSDWKRSFTKQ